MYNEVTYIDAKRASQNNDQRDNFARLMPLMTMYYCFVNRNLDWNRLRHGNRNVLHHGKRHELLNFHRNYFLDRRRYFFLHLCKHLFFNLRINERYRGRLDMEEVCWKKTNFKCEHSPDKERVSVRLPGLDNFVQRVEPASSGRATEPSSGLVFLS